jgi:hypothetical protein
MKDIEKKITLARTAKQCLFFAPSPLNSSWENSLLCSGMQVHSSDPNKEDIFSIPYIDIERQK